MKGSKEAVVKTKEKLASKLRPSKVDWKNEAKTLYRVLQGLLNYELPQDVHGSSGAYYHELREKIMTEMLRSNSRTDGKIKK